ncbi:MAG: PEP/pyruvate-binding domain-containing protein [Thermodesulfobacteriota bacterium]
MWKQIKALLKKKSGPGHDPAGMMNIFRKKYVNFKALLESNAELLKIIAGMEEKLTGQYVFGMSYIRSEMVRVVYHAFRMVKSFEDLSGRTYPDLHGTLNGIQAAVNQELELKNVPRLPDVVLPYTRITHDMVDYVGGKNANLGEVKSRCHLPIPRGFAITTTAFDELIEYNDIMDEIRKLKMEISGEDPQSLMRVSHDIQRLIIEAEIPKAVEEAILKAYEQEISPERSVPVALRSSAIGEDSELSYAGQYQSFLNVPAGDLIGKYKAVLASLFTPRAVSYRLHMGIPFEEAAMSVACLEMIRARAGGVVYTRHPFQLTENNIIINATWGLGSYVVDGTVSPDAFEVSKTSPPALLKKTIASKSVELTTNPDGYLMETPVSGDIRQTPCLTDEQALRLAEYALKLEAHFQGPQDIEWALDGDGNLIILQSRPLMIERCGDETCAPQRFEQYPVLVEGGEAASPGVGWGPACIVRSEEDLLSFPEGGVLVAANSSPEYVIVMPLARAIVTNLGSITGHMASLAREYKIPALLNTKNATQAIQPGEIVTVDAFGSRVYAGKVEELLDVQWHRGAFMKKTPVYQVLERLAQHVVPLHLKNPRSRRFTAGNCRTIHDIVRFTHEKSYGEIFHISDFTSDHGHISVKLSAPLPIDLYVIDLGGGLAAPEKARKITVDHVVSTPFRALLEGMLHKDLKPLEPRPIDVRGFLSVVSQQMLAPPNPVVERFGDRSYAIISDKYVNFSSRVGYHYSILDTFCGQTAMKNYIHFQFKGGAADNVRRNRRARLIRNILEARDFLVEVQGDRVTARFNKQAMELVLEKLDVLGRLLIFTRQMDMLMNTERSVDDLSARFLDGCYDLEKPRACRAEPEKG